MSKVPDDFAREPTTWSFAPGVEVPIPTAPVPLFITMAQFRLLSRLRNKSWSARTTPAFAVPLIIKEPAVVATDKLIDPVELFAVLKKRTASVALVADTVRMEVGFVVPMPTLPLPKIVTLAVLFVSNVIEPFCWFASVIFVPFP